MGVARLGGAHAAAAQLHAAARGVPHPRGCAGLLFGWVAACVLSALACRDLRASHSLSGTAVLPAAPALAHSGLQIHSWSPTCQPVCWPGLLPASAEIEVEVPVEHGLLVENLLDLVRPMAFRAFLDL